MTPTDSSGAAAPPSPADRVRLVSTSAGSYEVHVDGHLAGHVGKVGRKWAGRVGEFDIGEHPTRKEAIAAIVDVYLT